MKNLGNMLVIAGIAVFVIAVILRIMNLQPAINNPVETLWRVCIILLLAAVALGVNKQ